MSNTHCMVDLETLGVRPGSVILSIGAVAFDPVKGTVGETFYRVVDRASCEAVGLTVDQATLDWWDKQSEAAKAAVASLGIPLTYALSFFRDWWFEQRLKVLWSHGANFDEVLLNAAFRAVERQPPWKYYDVMCSRTIFSLSGVKPDRAKGTHHNALDDATAQAHAVIEAYRALGLSK